MSGPDWEHLATFVAVARAGSLTGGARDLGISQPTAGRHIGALEQALGTSLFVRHARGLALTDDGAALFEGADDVARRLEAVLRGPGGASGEVAGSVRISAAEPVGGHAIAPALIALGEAHPRLHIQLVIDNSPADLSRREADVAVRMFRPTQLDLVARRIGEVELGMFASKRYLERRGMPRGLEDLEGHRIIGHDRDAYWHRAIAELGLPASAFAYRTDSILAQIQAVRDGVGIGGLHLALAARDPDLVRVLSELPLQPLEMWLVMHRDLRGNPAVRTVYDQLATTLGEYLAPVRGLAGAAVERAKAPRHEPF